MPTSRGNHALTHPSVPIAQFQVDTLECSVFGSRAELGEAAAGEFASACRTALGSGANDFRVVFAAAPSQNEFLERLALRDDIPWSRIVAYHMDEYLGIGADHPASFRRFLIDRLFDRVGIEPESRRLIPGERTESPGRACQEYEDLLRDKPLHLVCAGIGENGHLAFNDPPVADFIDPLWVKIVRLDAACREQQVNDGCFGSIRDVPTHAYTMTIPALLSAPRLLVVVPGPRKAKAVRDALKGPIAEACPASCAPWTFGSDALPGSRVGGAARPRDGMSQVGRRDVSSRRRI